MKKTTIEKDLENLKEYCEYLGWSNKKGGDFDRGYRFGVEHIRQQIEKVLSCKWTKWGIGGFPEFKHFYKKKNKG